MSDDEEVLPATEGDKLIIALNRVEEEKADEVHFFLRLLSEKFPQTDPITNLYDPSEMAEEFIKEEAHPATGESDAESIRDYDSG